MAVTEKDMQDMRNWFDYELLSGRPVPKYEQTYRHFKGAEYWVWCTTSESQEVILDKLQPLAYVVRESDRAECVLMFDAENNKYFVKDPSDELMAGRWVAYGDSQNPLWIRPLSEFLESVSPGQPRFQLLGNDG